MAFPQPSELKGAVAGTLLYLSLYGFGFLQFQAYYNYINYYWRKKRSAKDGRAKTVPFREIKYYNSHDTTVLSGDRTVGNFVEQAIAFLPLFWLHAVLVDSSQSFAIGATYTFFRSYYPIVFCMKAPMAALSTIPGYVIVIYMLTQLAYHARST